MAAQYKRETRFPKKITVNLTVEQHTALTELAKRHGMSPGWLGRESITVGLPKVRESLRRSARRAKTA